jgi:hypothetical protein
MGLIDLLKSMRARPNQTPGRFVLRYAPQGGEVITVGHLEFDGAAWIFRYDDAYKGRTDLRPIEGFDDIARVYRSTVLFPFFAVRVPNLDRQDVKLKLAGRHLQKPDTTELLRLFGRKSVASPAFELLPA